MYTEEERLMMTTRTPDSIVFSIEGDQLQNYEIYTTGPSVG